MSRRLSVLIIIVAVLAGALFIDGQTDDTTTPPEPSIAERTKFPVATAPEALSSTWFCAGGTATTDDPFANHLVDIANPTDGSIEVAVTVFGGNVAAPLDQVDPESLDEEDGDAGDDDTGDGDNGDEEGQSAGDDGGGDTASEPPAPVTDTFTVAARSRRQIVLTDYLEAPVASALVEGDGGSLVVEHEIVSVHGRDAKPCATSSSDEWHFAWGDTSVDARQLLVLFNPYSDDAIVEGTFSTDDGPRQPRRFESLVVPARSVIAVDLGDDVTRREEVAATIRATSGRLIVDRIVRLNGEDGGRRGLTVQSGVPEPQLAWIYPDGFLSESIDERFAVYNPSEEVAEVEIAFALDDPETNGIPEPVLLSIPPGRHDYVDLTPDERLPAGVAHRATVRSANGVPIVAERLQFASGGSRQGISVTTGSPVEASQWFLAAGAATDATDEWLVIANLDPQVISTVTVTALTDGQATPVSELQEFEVAAGERRAIRLGEHITREALPIIVTATEPIVVERGLYRIGEGRGISNAIAVPGPEGLRLPADTLNLDVDVDLGDVDATTTTADPDAPPTAPDDVELPEPDATIPIPEDEDPDAGGDDNSGDGNNSGDGGDAGGGNDSG